MFENINISPQNILLVAVIVLASSASVFLLWRNHAKHSQAVGIIHIPNELKEK